MLRLILFIAFLSSAGLLGIAFRWIGIGLYFIFLFVILPILVFSVLYIVIRKIYHAFNPKAKQSFLERKAKKAADKQNHKERNEIEAEAKRKIAELGAKLEREATEKQKKELARQQHRDGDQQTTPYRYQIGKHGNESLAIRYGIANQERRRNIDRNGICYEPAKTIQLQKIKKVGENIYEVLLTDFRNRKAKAVIEVGTEYVKTFYPLNDNWFKKHADLEMTLKGNNSFTLKELATFHIHKTVDD